MNKPSKKRPKQQLQGLPATSLVRAPRPCAVCGGCLLVGARQIPWGGGAELHPENTDPRLLAYLTYLLRSWRRHPSMNHK